MGISLDSQREIHHALCLGDTQSIRVLIVVDKLVMMKGYKNQVKRSPRQVAVTSYLMLTIEVEQK